MKMRSAFAVLAMTVAVTACGELPFQNKTPPETAATAEQPKGPPAVSPIDQPIETGAEGTAVATAEASTMNTKMFRASGAGWTATAADKRAVYEAAGAKSTAVAVRRMTYARGVEFVGTMNGKVFSLNIQATECKAGDSALPFTAKLRTGGKTLTGCAGPTDTMPKAQVTASSAAPKPKAAAKPKPAATPIAAPAVAETKAPEVAPETKAPEATPVTAPATTPEAAPVTPAATVTETPAPTPTETPAPAPATGGVPAPQMVLPPTAPSTPQ